MAQKVSRSPILAAHTPVHTSAAATYATATGAFEAQCQYYTGGMEYLPKKMGCLRSWNGDRPYQLVTATLSMCQ